MASRGKNWAFTLNNPTPQLVGELFNVAGEVQEGVQPLPGTLKELLTHCAYLIVGHELAPTTGTEHLQGFIQFKDRVRMTQIKTWLGIDSVHLELAKKPPLANQRYCQKTGKFREFGEISNVSQGTRTTFYTIKN